jgi:hypothetical protein
VRAFDAAGNASPFIVPAGNFSISGYAGYFRIFLPLAFKNDRIQAVTNNSTVDETDY